MSFEGQPDKKTIIVESIERAMPLVVKRCLEIQRERYHRLDFHNENHPEFAIQAALEFLEVIKGADLSVVNEEDFRDVKIIMAGHDLVQDADDSGEMLVRFGGFDEGDNEKTLKKYGVRKGNERKSADELLEILEGVHNLHGQQVFSLNDPVYRQRIERGVRVTFPEFDFMATIPEETFAALFSHLSANSDMSDLKRYQKGIKVSHAHLKPESSMLEFAAAHGDLRGEVASENVKDFRRGGSAEFRELHIFIRRELAKGITKTAEGKIEGEIFKRKSEVADKVLNWIRSQITFAMWQKVLFWEVVNSSKIIGANTAVKEALAKVYNSRFDRNIVTARNRYEKWEEKYGRFEDKNGRQEILSGTTNEDFLELLKEIGYELSI